MASSSSSSSSSSPSNPGISILPVQTPKDLAATISLFQSYVCWLNLDLSFQDFDTEMARMPGKYSPPNGALFLARLQPTNEAVGCVGLRPLTEPGGIGIGIAEMKRLYVDPAGRGMGVGRKLADAVVAEARRLGYEAVLLDTLPHMLSAIGLYKSLGFVEVEPYYATPLEGTVFLRLDLKSGLGE